MCTSTQVLRLGVLYWLSIIWCYLRFLFDKFIVDDVKYLEKIFEHVHKHSLNQNARGIFRSKLIHVKFGQEGLHIIWKFETSYIYW